MKEFSEIRFRDHVVLDGKHENYFAAERSRVRITNDGGPLVQLEAKSGATTLVPWANVLFACVAVKKAEPKK